MKKQLIIYFGEYFIKNNVKQKSFFKELLEGTSKISFINLKTPINLILI